MKKLATVTAATSLGILISLILALLLGLASVTSALSSYGATISFSNTSATSYPMLPIIVSCNNTYLAAQGYITPSGTDVQVTSGNTSLPRLVADDKTLFAMPVPANSSQSVELKTGQTPSDMAIVTGYNGYVTTPDNSSLQEGTDNITVSITAWVDSSVAGVIWQKGSAFSLYDNGDESYTAIVNDGTPYSATVTGISSGLHTFTVTLSRGAGTYDLTTSAAGQAKRTLSNPGEAFATLWGSVGNDHYDGLVGFLMQPAGYDYTDNWTQLIRSPMVFDLSAVSGTITSATLDVTFDEKDNGVSGSTWSPAPNICVYQSSTLSHSTISDQDYDVTGWVGTDLTDRKAYSDVTLGVPTTFTFNSAGLATINTAVGSWLDIGFRNQNYDALGTPPTWNYWVSYQWMRMEAFAATVTLHLATSSANQISLTVDSTTDTQNAVTLTGSDNWTWMSNIVPYAASISIDVDGSQVLLYQPNDIVDGTTLPDISGSSGNDGTIHWGSLILTATTSGFFSMAPAGMQPNESLDVIPAITPPPEYLPESAIEASLHSDPFYGIVYWLTQWAAPLGVGTVGIVFTYRIIFFLLGLIIFLLTYAYTRHFLFAGIGPTILWGYGMAKLIIPWYGFLALILLWIGLSVMEGRQAPT